jgi:hypothetical protein
LRPSDQRVEVTLELGRTRVEDTDLPGILELLEAILRAKAFEAEPLRASHSNVFTCAT